MKDLWFVVDLERGERIIKERIASWFSECKLLVSGCFFFCCCCWWLCWSRIHSKTSRGRSNSTHRFFDLLQPLGVSGTPPVQQRSEFWGRKRVLEVFAFIGNWTSEKFSDQRGGENLNGGAKGLFPSQLVSFCLAWPMCLSCCCWLNYPTRHDYTVPDLGWELSSQFMRV